MKIIYNKKYDLTGKVFGKLTVIERDFSKTGGAAYWICECSCPAHTRKSINGSRLRSGEVIDCGCGAKERRKIDTSSLIGQVFGRLTVIERDLSVPYGRGYGSKWICKCNCGNTCSVDRASLVRGHTQSCGCLKSEQLTERNRKDITGQRFGKLLALKNTEKQNKKLDFLWLCKCDCGQYCEEPVSYLTSGRVISCGCTRSKGENLIQKILLENNIKFKREYKFSDLRNPKTGKQLRYDFAILDINNNPIRLIEFDGEQHYGLGGWTKDSFSDIKERDSLKNDYAKINNIPLVRIPYYINFNNITLETLLGDSYLL